MAESNELNPTTPAMEPALDAPGASPMEDDAIAAGQTMVDAAVEAVADAAHAVAEAPVPAAPVASGAFAEPAYAVVNPAPAAPVPAAPQAPGAAAPAFVATQPQPVAPAAFGAAAPYGQPAPAVFDQPATAAPYAAPGFAAPAPQAAAAFGAAPQADPVHDQPFQAAPAPGVAGAAPAAASYQAPTPAAMNVAGMPLVALTGGMKFGWAALGFLMGPVAILIAWLVNLASYPQVKSDAIKFSIIGFAATFVVSLVLVLLFGAAACAALIPLGMHY